MDNATNMRVAVIGAGASGMMAMATLVERGVSGKDVVLFEGNPSMGKKVAITGGGRCNVTTSISSKKELLSKYSRGASFVESAIGKFSPKKAREWFEANGCPLKAEEDGRVFPVSDRASDVVAVFERIARNSGADVRFGCRVASVARDPSGKFRLTLADGSDAGSLFDAVVLATGGAAYSKTGSDGTGYAIARGLGHSVTPLAPSLSAFTVAEPWCGDLAGLALSSVRFADSQGKALAEGAAMFTHSGVTGPAVFALSARIAFESVSESEPFGVRLVPDSSRRFDDWERDLSSAFASDGAKETKNVLSAFFARRFAETVPGLAGVAAERKAASVSRDERRAIVRLLSDGIPLRLTGRRPGEEFVTAGGISTDEFDPETMESRIVPGFYATGEVLDVDAVTGGFNLQACWATGHAAGKSVAERFAKAR